MLIGSRCSSTARVKKNRSIYAQPRDRRLDIRGLDKTEKPQSWDTENVPNGKLQSALHILMAIACASARPLYTVMMVSRQFFM